MIMHWLVYLNLCVLFIFAILPNQVLVLSHLYIRRIFPINTDHPAVVSIKQLNIIAVVGCGPQRSQSTPVKVLRFKPILLEERRDVK
jgi:hypothetical protein